MDRSENMRAIRGKDSKPEKTVRSMLHRLGYRFRLHRNSLPGTPDVVFPSRRKVIHVHGCFWHMHACRKGKSTPASNTTFWAAKRRRTVERDREVLRALSAQGWDALTVWECELQDLDAVRRRVEAFLSRGTRSPADLSDARASAHRSRRIEREAHAR